MPIKKRLIILMIITLVGFTIRFYKMTDSPAGLYIDETSIGYNAYSIVETGRDEHGRFMPLFFEAFGEYKLPIYIYSVVLAQLILGPSDLSVRLPSVIFGVLTIPLLFFFVRELLTDKRYVIYKDEVAIIGTFLLAVSPWHFQFTRPGFEASSGLFFFVLALFLFFKAANQKSKNLIVFSIVSFVLTFYSYNAARIVTPITLATLLTLYCRKFHILTWATALLIGFLLSLPFLFFALSAEGLVRAKQVSIFYQPLERPIVLQFISNFWKNVSPFYLFGTGDPTIAHLTEHRMSLLYLTELPFFVIGLIVMFIKRSKEYIFILILFLMALIPPAISTLSPHSLRGFFSLPSTIFISALGLGVLVSKSDNKTFKKLIISVYVFALAISALKFVNIYHNKYAIDAGWDWQVDAKEVSLIVARLESDYDRVYFDSGLRNIAILWYLKIDPGLYQKALDMNTIGKYVFEADFSSLSSKNEKSLYVTNKHIQGTKLLQHIKYPNGEVAYGIWELNKDKIN